MGQILHEIMKGFHQRTFGFHTGLYVKGAPESVVERCTHARLGDGSTVAFTAAHKKSVLAHIAEMAARPLR